MREPESAQALLALVPDVLGAPAWGKGGLPRFDPARREPRLRADEEVVGVRMERLGEDLLTLAVSVDVGDVDEVDPRVVHGAVDRSSLAPVAFPFGVARRGHAHRT